jgi:hypothetical protein
MKEDAAALSSTANDNAPTRAVGPLQQIGTLQKVGYGGVRFSEYSWILAQTDGGQVLMQRRPRLPQADNSGP